MTTKNLPSFDPPSLADEIAAARLPAEPTAPDAAEDEAKRREEDLRRRRSEEKYTFTLPLITHGSKKFLGPDEPFVSTIPTIAERQTIARLRARFSGGAAFETLDPTTRELNFVVAELSIRLTWGGVGDPPLWFADVSKLRFVDVLYALYEEVSAHEATFLGQR